jgi:hypothetical protein
MSVCFICFVRSVLLIFLVPVLRFSLVFILCLVLYVGHVPSLFSSVLLSTSYSTDILLNLFVHCNTTSWYRGRRGRMVVGFTTTYAISVYHHWCWEFESRVLRPRYNWNIVEGGATHHQTNKLRDTNKLYLLFTNGQIKLFVFPIT